MKSLELVGHSGIDGKFKGIKGRGKMKLEINLGVKVQIVQKAMENRP